MQTGNDYRSCCRLAASESDTAFCPECGNQLYRCAYRECQSLISPNSHCSICIRPQLYVEKNAVLAAGKGECLSIPFVLKNDSPVTHALSIRNVLKYGKNVRNETVPINWEKLEAGRERSFFVETEPFPDGGINILGLTIIVASRVEDIEELYAFSGEILIDVEGAGEDPSQIVQNFNLNGASLGTGVLINASSKIGESGYKKRQAEARTTRVEVPLERAERYELKNGYRGYQTLGGRIPRNVEFVYTGFPMDDKPADGALRGGQPIIRCGRNSRRFDAQQNPKPNDLCLRIYNATSGELDPDGSSAISRHLCEFMLQNDRLYLRALSDRGLTQNGEILKAGDIVIVNHGDSFTTPVKSSKTVTFGTKFKVSRDVVTQVRFEVGKDAARRHD